MTQGYRPHSYGWRHRMVAVSCEQGTEASSSIKGRKFLKYLSAASQESLCSLELGVTHKFWISAEFNLLHKEKDIAVTFKFNFKRRFYFQTLNIDTVCDWIERKAAILSIASVELFCCTSMRLLVQENCRGYWLLSYTPNHILWAEAGSVRPLALSQNQYH
jgi:hypothetical protein